MTDAHTDNVEGSLPIRLPSGAEARIAFAIRIPAIAGRYGAEQDREWAVRQIEQLVTTLAARYGPPVPREVIELERAQHDALALPAFKTTRRRKR